MNYETFEYLIGAKFVSFLIKVVIDNKKQEFNTTGQGYKQQFTRIYKCPIKYENNSYKINNKRNENYGFNKK